MKTFVFDEYKQCINPNRIGRGNQNFYFEIWTACKDGKWYAGHMYWTRGEHMEDKPALNTNSYDTEHLAIHVEVLHFTKYLRYSKDWNDKFPNHGLDVPDFVFRELKDLEIKSKNPQMELF